MVLTAWLERRRLKGDVRTFFHAFLRAFPTKIIASWWDTYGHSVDQVSRSAKASSAIQVAYEMIRVILPREILKMHAKERQQVWRDLERLAAGEQIEADCLARRLSNLLSDISAAEINGYLEVQSSRYVEVRNFWRVG